MAWPGILAGPGEQAPGTACQHAARAERPCTRTVLACAQEPMLSDAVCAEQAASAVI